MAERAAAASAISAAERVAVEAQLRRRDLPPRLRERLETAAETPPPTLGLPFDVWTSGRLSAYLAATTGVRIAPGWLRALLARQRFASGRPKHSMRHLRDPEEVALCAAELAAVGGKG